MKRNILHKIESQLFKIHSPFNFLNYTETNQLINQLEKDIKKSSFCPDIVVGISYGGEFPADELSKRMFLNKSNMKISHYSLRLGGLELDEIIGVYRIAKIFGYKTKTELIKNVDQERIKSKKVLLIDDDSYSGETLKMGIQAIIENKPKDIKVAVIHTYEGNKLVDFVGKLYKKEDYYKLKLRFPWSKMSPYFKETPLRIATQNL
jgi:hypoxanthine phosphoribosyltransferase